MTHLIDKDALTAEIKKLKGKADDESSYCNGWQQALRMLEIVLDTLEVKEIPKWKKTISDGWYVVPMMENIKNKVMTQEDKELLLKDLSARLPCEVKVKVRSNDIRTVRAVDMVEGIVHFVESDSISPFGVHIEHPMTFRQVVKPYLRPMSSMTEEECIALSKLIPYETDAWKYIKTPIPLYIANIEQFDFFHRHHLDWRGLILKGLALEAPEGMYNNKMEE